MEHVCLAITPHFATPVWAATTTHDVVLQQYNKITNPHHYLHNQFHLSTSPTLAAVKLHTLLPIAHLNISYKFNLSVYCSQLKLLFPSTLKSDLPAMLAQATSFVAIFRIHLLQINRNQYSRIQPAVAAVLFCCRLQSADYQNHWVSIWQNYAWIGPVSFSGPSLFLGGT